MKANHDTAERVVDGGAVERSFTLRNDHGLHARTATQFVQLAKTFDSEIDIEKDGQQQNGKSVVGVLMLLADKGASITVRARGIDAERAMAAIADLITDRFGQQSDDELSDGS